MLRQFRPLVIYKFIMSKLLAAIVLDKKFFIITYNIDQFSFNNLNVVNLYDVW